MTRSLFRIDVRRQHDPKGLTVGHRPEKRSLLGCGGNDVRDWAI